MIAILFVLAQMLQAQADALRADGNCEAAIELYREAIDAGGPQAALLSDIGNCYEGLKRDRAAAAAYREAGAQENFDRLRRRRGFVISTDLGGDEPSTSRQAVNAQVRYGGIDGVDLVAGYGFSDQVYFTSNKGFVTGYWFYSGASYVKADLTLRRYSYPDDPATLQPNPDSSSYDWAPRGELEVSHWLGRSVRAALDYQLYVPNFFYDPLVRLHNHKLSGELEWVTPLPGLRLTALVAGLRDPDPSQTTIKGRAGATATQVMYRTTSLAGVAAALSGERFSLEARVLPNRDLDASYAWSILSSAGVQGTPALRLSLQHVYDRYASVSVFAGRHANIAMAQAQWAVSAGLRLSGGVRYVDAPTREGFTALLGAEVRTGLW
jgi:hypothetical protein